jgi:hypothetical protein
VVLRIKKRFTTDDTDGTDGFQRRMLSSVPSVSSVVPPPLHPWNFAEVSIGVAGEPGEEITP